MSAEHDPRFVDLPPRTPWGARRRRAARPRRTRGLRELPLALAAWQREARRWRSAPAIPPAKTTRARCCARSAYAAGRTATAANRRAPRPRARPAPDGGRRRRRSRWRYGPKQRALRRENARLAAEHGDRRAARPGVVRFDARGDGVCGLAPRGSFDARPAPGGPGRPAEALAAVAHSFVNPQSIALSSRRTTGAAPAGKTYQLWFIADGKPVLAGSSTSTPRAARNWWSRRRAARRDPGLGGDRRAPRARAAAHRKMVLGVSARQPPRELPLSVRARRKPRGPRAVQPGLPRVKQGWRCAPRGEGLAS
jgi:hypothetical protein